jgi:hypothetical protein
MRGTGLSTREVADYSFEAQLLDIDAVVEKLGYPALQSLARQTPGRWLSPMPPAIQTEFHAGCFGTASHRR